MVRMLRQHHSDNGSPMRIDTSHEQALDRFAPGRATAPRKIPVLARYSAGIN